MATTDADDLQNMISEQRQELMAAEALESDLEFAFRLQLEEAMAASLTLQPSSSSSRPSNRASINHSQLHDDVVFNFASLQNKEIERFEQERRDREKSEREMRRMVDDMNRRIHDQNFAEEILKIPEEDWDEHGDNVERPYGEGPSESSEVFNLYFKGLINEEWVRGSTVSLAGIGVAICDSKDNLIFELRKPLPCNGMNRQALEIIALIEGLNAAFTLDLKRITYFCDYYPLYQFFTGRWTPKQRKVATLIRQVNDFRRKFTFCAVSLVARYDIKFAFKLARDAILSQITKSTESGSANISTEVCVICLEDTEANQMYTVDSCQHRYCFSCMKQHVEVKLLHGTMPKCPHEGCNIGLDVENCTKFLTPKLIEMMTQRKKENSIPVTEKVYCPNPKCSALMSKSEVLEYAKSFGAERSAARKCTICHGLFCIDCKVPWHSNMTCWDYKKKNPEDLKLKSLANRNLWRQCVKCNHMIELAEGCYHMTCRCGYEFCYTCGAEWKDKKATCSCPLWDEANIIRSEQDRDFYEDLYDDDDDDDDDDDYDSEYGEDDYSYFIDIDNESDLEEL